MLVLLPTRYAYGVGLSQLPQIAKACWEVR